MLVYIKKTSLFLNVYLFLLNVHDACLYLCKCAWMPGAFRGQTSVSESKLQMFVNSHRVLGAESYPQQKQQLFITPKPSP